MTSVQIQGTPTHLPLLVISLIVTNVWVLMTLPSFYNSDGRIMFLNVSKAQKQTFLFVSGDINCCEDFCIQMLSKLSFNWKIFNIGGPKLKKIQLKAEDIHVLECWQMSIYPHPLPCHHLHVFWNSVLNLTPTYLLHARHKIYRFFFWGRP